MSNASRCRPKIFNWSYLVLSDLKKQIVKFANKYPNQKEDYKILDVGCGLAPYKIFFRNFKDYLCLDTFDAPNINIKGTIEKVPLNDDSIDFILCTQVLEHTSDVSQSISEIHRVLKKGGLAFLSFPFAAHIHGKDDRWRFSPYTIELLFKDFEILSIQNSGSVFISLGQYLNTFIAYFPLGRYLGIPFFMVNNLLAMIMNFLLQNIILFPFKLIMSRDAYQQMRFNIVDSLPLNYSLVIKK